MASVSKDFKVRNGIVAGSKIQAPASTLSIAPLNITHGTAPTTPVNGDIWTTSAGLYVQINGTTIGPLGTGTSGGSVTTSDTAPSSPSTGNIWFKTSTGKTYIYYDSYWVEIGTSADNNPKVSDTAPSSPTSGDLWFQSTTGFLFIYYDSYWVQIGGDPSPSYSTAITTWLTTPTSSNLALAVSDETGTGSLVFNDSPTFTGTVTLPLTTAGVVTTTSGGVLASTALVPIANGGTNSSATPTSGGIGYGTGTAHAYTSAGTAGQVLQSNGSSAPTWATIVSSAYQATAPTSPSTGALWVDSDLDVLYVYTGATNSWVSPMAIQMSTPTFSTNNYNAILSDRSKMLLLTNGTTAGTITLSSSVAFPIGTQIQIVQTGTGQISIVGSGVTVNATPGLKLRTQYSSATLVKTASTTWLAVGDLSA